jgi:hypothetical protein
MKKGLSGDFMVDEASSALDKERRELISALDRYNRGTAGTA